MVIVNNKEMVISGSNLAEIGEKLVEASPNGNGKGLTISMGVEEFAYLGGSNGIMKLITDAVKKETGHSPQILHKCTYQGKHLLTTY